MRATAAVVEFISRARWPDFPSDAVALAKRCVIDGLGVMLAGSTTGASTILSEYTRASDGRTDATVFAPEPFRTGAASAALLNGISGHALDWDDTQLSTSADRIFGLLTHPTMPPLAAALALGERQHASGARFLEAFLTGFEVECKIAEAIDPSHYLRGFHSSGTIGTFASAAAAAKLMKLNDAQLKHMLAIAASMSSGIRVNFGSMTKPLHVGRAAQNGILAAELAAGGFTGGDDGLDGRPAAQFTLDLGRHPSLLAGDEDPELVIGRRIVAAISPVGEEAGDDVADERLHVRDHGGQRVTVIGIAGQRLHMGDELAALGVADRGGDGDLDAELIRPVGLALADAFDFRCVQRIDLGPALALL